jgi:Ca-activated chloride channel family protein
LLIVALAQPRLTKSTTEVKASGVDIVVAFDLSGSMLSEDFEVKGERINRFNMSREVLKGFIEKRPNDRIGMVLFASQAFIGTPLTLDHDFLQANLNRMELGMIEQNSTAIGDGLGTAVNRLRDLKAKSKIVILMTDGQNNAGKLDPSLAAEAAKSLGVKVYTVGIGMRGQAPMPARDMFGRKVYQMVQVDIDEDTLQKIAGMTGGKYYRADNAAKFKQIYDEIDKLEKTEASVKKYTQFTELFAWFVAAGLTILLLEFVLAQTAFRRLP